MNWGGFFVGIFNSFRGRREATKAGRVSDEIERDGLERTGTERTGKERPETERAETEWNG